MNDAQKARLAELSAKPADQLSAIEKNELDLLKTISTQAAQIASANTLIGTHGTKLDELTRQLAAAKPEEKAALEGQIADLKSIIATLTEANKVLAGSAASNSDALTKISVVKPGQGASVDRKTVDAIEDEVLAAKGGQEIVEKAYSQLSDEDADALETDLAFRNEFFSQALTAIKRENAERSPWRKRPEDKGVPAHDDSAARVAQLFGNQQAIHRKLPPGSSGRPGGPGAIRDSGKPKAAERTVDTRTK